jgi:predicted nucleotidyltransferase
MIYPNSQTHDYMSFLKIELSDWFIDCVFEFSSHANGEAIRSSDFDLFVTTHANDKIHISESYKRRRDYNYFVSHVINLKLIGGDIRDQLNYKWYISHQCSRTIWVSQPVCEIKKTYM